ncbi:hypothetical protein ACIODW_03995 [Streptomyces sp. NPDC087897]|uniref:hypothetical protein n=1 Tax=Streptomyces sp. NPDC087897 TaxID=3365817 RepID=UPI00380002FC
MSVRPIGTDDEALERAALRDRHLDRARTRGAVEDAERRHRAEKDAAAGEHGIHDVT